ncbi:uncharacterized protein METZ01_LOCUS429488 [marine metagenome]|uniref:Uncharacterized protein n=1 Tax=marine metagenome TaxID=408172 RepID=A0A382Y0E7_9ZZZZ
MILVTGGFDLESDLQGEIQNIFQPRMGI